MKTEKEPREHHEAACLERAKEYINNNGEPSIGYVNRISAFATVLEIPVDDVVNHVNDVILFVRRIPLALAMGRKPHFLQSDIIQSYKQTTVFS